MTFRVLVGVALTKYGSKPKLSLSLEQWCFNLVILLPCVKLKTLARSVRFLRKRRCKLLDILLLVGLVLTTVNVCKHTRTTPIIHNTYKRTKKSLNLVDCAAEYAVTSMLCLTNKRQTYAKGKGHHRIGKALASKHLK